MPWLKMPLKFLRGLRTPSSVNFISSHGSSGPCKFTKAAVAQAPSQTVLRRCPNVLILHLALLSAVQNKSSLSWTWKSAVKMEISVTGFEEVALELHPSNGESGSDFMIWKLPLHSIG